VDELVNRYFPPREGRSQFRRRLRQHEADGPTLTDEQVLDAIRSSGASQSFEILFSHGDIGQYGDDWSRADLALCNYLTKYSHDPDQLDRLFRRSALYRPKWDREDYRTRTIEKALIK
jgi:putative DNA primase/helicase